MTTKSRKAISPIIATILIMMMVVAAAGGMFFWASRIQGQQQGGVESFQSKFFKTASTAASVLKTNYNDSTQILNIFVQNTGNNPIPVSNLTSYPTTEWIVLDSSQNSICSSNWGNDGASSTGPKCNAGCGGANIEIGQIKQIILNFTNSSTCLIRSQPNSSRISFTIDFSGLTTAGGSFDK
ncbi:MAG TPA: hypothetical protein HA224_02965 [Nanoarchaeota archaeon]|nr:hypothetical protein [Nanoarchaeota archaeon]